MYKQAAKLFQKLFFSFWTMLLMLIGE